MLVGAFVVVSGLTLPLWGEMDLAPSDKVYVGLIYAVLGLAVAGVGVGLFRLGRR